MNLTLVSFKIFVFTTFFMTMNVTLEITGFDNDKGKAFVEIIDDKGKIVSQLVLPINQKKIVKSIELPSSGKFGVKVFHDENNNQKMDKNLVGYPTEKWGVSNGARPSFRAPKTEEILVTLKAGDKIKITVE